MQLFEVLVSVSCWVRGGSDEPERGIFRSKIRHFDSNVADRWRTTVTPWVSLELSLVRITPQNIWEI